MGKRHPRGEGHRLREEILDATIDLLAETGDARAVSVRTIAQRVGRSTPLIYEHFADRDALLFEAARQALEAMGRAVDAETASEQDVALRLRARAHAYVDFARRHPEPYRILFMDPKHSGSLSIEEMLETTGLSGVRRELDVAIDAGLMAPRDTALTALTLWTALHGVASLVITHPALEWPDQLLDAVLDDLRDGLSATG